jgi:peroxiredoxin
MNRLGLETAALCLCLALALAGCGVALAQIAPGKPAPDFVGRDTSGKEVRLSGLKGNIVVLEWTNHDCPYVGKHYGAGNMQALQKEATGQGVVWLSIVSSAPGQQGHVDGLEADRLTASRKASPTAVVLDPEGLIGRAYGASTTPHMFVIDKAGTLAYMGAIDDMPSASRADIKGARNFVREALAAVAKGEPVKAASTRPYGCSVKYSTPRS